MNWHSMLLMLEFLLVFCSHPGLCTCCLRCVCALWSAVLVAICGYDPRAALFFSALVHFAWIAWMLGLELFANEWVSHQKATEFRLGRLESLRAAELKAAELANLSWSLATRSQRKHLLRAAEAFQRCMEEAAAWQEFMARSESGVRQVSGYLAAPSHPLSFLAI